MGSLFGGGSTKTTSNTQSSSNQSSSSSPWAPEAAQVTNLENQAGLNLSQQEARGPYSGNYIAGQNNFQQQAINSGAFGGQTVVNQGTAQAQTGANLLNGAAPGYVSNADGLYGTSALTQNPALSGTLSGYATGTGSGLSSALNSAALSGAQFIQSAQTQLAQNAATAASDPTARLTGDAQSYMNSAPVQSAINSTNAGIAQTLDEQTAPGLDRAAAAGGSLNSSRAGAAQAVAQGQAAMAQGSADASIQNNAYNQGLGTALSSYESGLNSSNAAATASGSLGNSSSLGTAGLQTGAANSGLGYGLSYQQDSFNNGLNANAQLGNAVSLGNQAINGGAAGVATGTSLQGAAGASEYQAYQNGLTNSIDQYNAQNNYGTGILGQYQGLIQGNYGQNTTGSSSGTTSGTSTQTQNGSVIGGLLGAASLGAGIYSGFTGSPIFGTGAATAPSTFGGNPFSPAFATAAGIYG